MKNHVKKLKEKNNLLFFVIINSIFFIIILLFIGILSGLIIGAIYEEINATLLRIILINSTILSFGIIITAGISKFLVSKIKNIFIMIISFLMILGISIIGFIFLIFTEPVFFLYGKNIVFPYVSLNLLFALSLSSITSGFVIFQETIDKKEKALNEEKILRKQIEQQLHLSKINPHFLFNSLNLILSLLNKPEKAEKVLLNLSELLRYNLDASSKERITINEEISNVEHYLYIQKMRFEERLEYSIKCETDGTIPPLIIQPLVENSIKHNLDKLNYLKINVDIFNECGIIVIKIIDSNKKLTGEMIGKGIGLIATKKRVENDNGTFQIKDGGIELRIKQ
jgi:two-component system, LytTR family, sensor kinase